MAEKGRISSWSVFRIILLPCMFLCTITKKPVFQWLALAALLLWVAIEIIRLISSARKKRNSKGKLEKKAARRKKSDRKNSEDNSLLLQVNYRITEQLKATYPDAAWLWTAKPSQEELKHGGTWRISLQNTDPFNFAEITLRNSGAMQIDLMQVTSLHKTAKEPDPDENDLTPGEILNRFDVQEWYNEIGEEALCDIVDELNTQGYKQLRISEDGDVTITAKGGERCFAAIDRFPPKTVWEDLCMLLRQDDIKASISGSQIAIAW